MRRLLEIGRGVVSELDLEVVLRRVAEEARDITGARFAALGVLDEDRQRLRRFIHVGLEPEEALAIGDLPRGRGVLGELIREPHTLRLREVSAHPHSYGFPTGHPPMRSFLGVPILIRGEAFGNLYLTEKRDAAEFDEADVEAVEVLASWAAVAIENARLYTSIAEREVRLGRALHQVEADVEITRAVGAETDLDVVLELIAKRARALVEAGTVALYLVAEEGLELVASAGRPAEPLPGMRRSIPSGQLDAVVAEGELLVPLEFRGRSLGVLAAFDRKEGGAGFGEEDLLLLRSFATSAAIAVATAQTVEEKRLQARVDAAERERGYWARELHDETLQQLAAIRLTLAGSVKAAGAGGGAGPEEAVRAAAAEAVERLGAEIDSLARLISELRPAPLETLGLAGALHSLAADASRGEQLTVASEVAIDSVLSADEERAIYRLVQEGLNNVVKHSKAARAAVVVAERDRFLELSVRDEGVGFDPASVTSGLGLGSMRDRVELLGGTLEVVPSRSGTEIRARIPLGAR